MSGNPTSNVVPMPHVAAPAAAPQMPMPMPGMWGGGGSLPWGPGCCPPGGMDALMKCYCDVQAATAFICSVMVTCIQTNPAVTAAIIAAIEASGSSLPLIGVTNGQDAQPGQVGQVVIFSVPLTYPASANNTQNVSVGVLPPGDWDIYTSLNFGTEFVSAYFANNPTPPGVGAIQAGFVVSTAMPGYDTLLGPTVQANTTAPELMAFTINTNSTVAGNMLFTFFARRAR